MRANISLGYNLMEPHPFATYAEVRYQIDAAVQAIRDMAGDEARKQFAEQYGKHLAGIK